MLLSKNINETKKVGVHNCCQYLVFGGKEGEGKLLTRYMSDMCPHIYIYLKNLITRGLIKTIYIVQSCISSFDDLRLRIVRTY